MNYGRNFRTPVFWRRAFNFCCVGFEHNRNDECHLFQFNLLAVCRSLFGKCNVCAVA